MKSFNKHFILMIIGQIISLFGAAILKFALSLYVLDITGRADVFATILAISTLPVIFLSPIGGAVADRFSRRNLMVIFDFSSSTIVFVFAFLIMKMEPSVILIGIIMTLLSVISTMYQPTVQSSIPVLVSEENLIKANGIVSGVGALTNIIAPIIGGMIYSIMELNHIVLIGGFSFFFSAVMELFIKIPFQKQDHAGHIVYAIFKDIKGGVSYIIKENPLILQCMLLAAALNLFLVPLVLVGMPYIIKIVMGASSTSYGVAQGVTSFGTILAAAAIGSIGKRMKMNTLYLWLMSAGGMVLLMGLSVSPAFLRLGFWVPLILFTLCIMLVLFIRC